MTFEHLYMIIICFLIKCVLCLEEFVLRLV